MAIQYIGTTISGIASDTKPTPTANEKGVIFIETDTNKIYQWDTDSWNQVITSTNVAVGALNSGSITSGFGTIDTGSSNITTTGTITAGNLDVTGTTTTIDSTNTTIADRLIELANGAGSSTADAGIIVERGSTGDNAIIAWDESADTWTIGTTTATGASTGDLSITAGTLVANLTGTASLATVATSTTITDNESTNENNLIPFVANAATATGNHTLEMDGNVHYNPSTGTITAPVFAGALTGNVTGNVSGTAPAGTLTGTTLASGVTASSLTTVGTLTALQVDNLNVNANTITATTGAVNITPAAGSAIVLDGTINVDAGVVTGATSITSTAFVGTIDGVVGGNTPAAITGTTIDANTDFTVGDTVITDGVITDSTGLSIAAAVDLGSNTFTTTGLISGGSLDIDNVLINGTTIGHTDDTDLLTVANAALTLKGTLTVGVDDAGHDVIFYGNAASANVTWDTSADDLIFNGAAGLIVPDGQLTLGSTAVTSTAAELNLLDNVSGLVQADLTKLAAIDATAAEVDTLDALSRGSIIYGNNSGATTVLTKGTADQILTSDGTDIAWQDAAGGGGGTTTLTVASGKTIEPGMAVGINAAGEAIPFDQGSGDYTGMTPYKPDATKSVRYMQVSYDTETDIHIAVYTKASHANVLENGMYAAPFTVDADDNITFGTELQITTNECIYGKYTVEYCTTRQQFVLIYLRGNGAAAPQGIRGYLLKPVAGTPNTIVKSTYFDVISSTSIGSYLPDIWDSSSSSDHRMVVTYIGSNNYVMCRVLDLNSAWDEGNGNSHGVTVGSQVTMFGYSQSHPSTGDWTRSTKTTGSSPTGGKQQILLGAYAWGFDIGTSGTSINNIDRNTRHPASGRENDTMYAGTAGEVHALYKHNNSFYLVRAYIGTSNIVAVDSTYSHYDSNAVLGNYPQNFRLVWTNTTDKIVAVQHRGSQSQSYVPGTSEWHYRGMGYKQYTLESDNTYTSDESTLGQGQVKVNYLIANGYFVGSASTNRDLGVCYNPDRSRAVIASSHSAYTSDQPIGNLGLNYRSPGSGIWMIKIQSGELNDERGTVPPFIGFGADASNVTAGNTVTVTVTGGVNEQLTGLSVGADYFLDSFGTLNPYYPLPVTDINILAGKAIATNKLLVYGTHAPVNMYGGIQ